MDFASSFGVTCSKDVWPYLFYTDINQIKSAVTFPPIGVFCDQQPEEAVETFEDCCFSLLASGAVKNFGGCLDYFGISKKEFSETELANMTMLDEKQVVIASNLKICPQVAAVYTPVVRFVILIYLEIRRF